MLGEAPVSARPGGLNRYFEGLHAALHMQGAGPTAVLLGPGRDTPGDVAVAADLRAPLLRRLLTYRRQAVRLGAGADLVDAHFALYAVLPLLTTALRRRPLVVHFQGPWADESAANRGAGADVPIKRALERLVYRRADRIIVLSDAFGRLVADQYDVDRDRIVVIPPGVDVARFVPGDLHAARRRFGVDNGGFVVVAARRLERRMGLATLLEAWARVQAAAPDAVLLIAGEGPRHDELEAARARLPCPGRVRLLGRIDDAQLVDLYCAADCSVVPSTRLEGFGLSVLESMACGTPAIVTDVGGLPEAVGAVDCSLVVPPADPVRLADRLVAAAAGALPSRAACRAHAETFRWDGVARRHLDLYAEMDPAAARRPRVVFLDHCAQPSGGELALLRLLTALDVDPHVILAEDGPLVDRFRANGVAVDVVPMAAAGRRLPRENVRLAPALAVAAIVSIAYTVRLAWRLRRLRPDLVHTNSLKAALYGGLAGRMVGVPVVWHLRDRIASDYLPPPAVRLVRAASRILPSALIANSDATLVSLGRPGVVVPSPVDGAAVIGSARSTRRPDDPLHVGMVGRLAPWKGQHVFVDAFARAFPDGPARGMVVGSPLFGAQDEVYEHEIRCRIERSGLADRVELRGHVEDVAEAYRDLDVLVHASVLPEPFGLVVAEGMAAGVAVVAADAGGPAELITDGVDGRLYPPGDVDALAACLRMLGTDEEMRMRLGRAARRRVAMLTPERVAPRVANVYLDVLATRRTPASTDQRGRNPPPGVGRDPTRGTAARPAPRAGGGRPRPTSGGK
jgi:glycosyltransferase involved in cell wall biosynthesis